MQMRTGVVEGMRRERDGLLMQLKSDTFAELLKTNIIPNTQDCKS